MSKFCHLVSNTVRAFRQVRGPLDLLDELDLGDATALVDDDPEALQRPMPTEMFLFGFDDGPGIRGEIELAFSPNRELVNAWIQLFFIAGENGARQASDFWTSELEPFVRNYFAQFAPREHPALPSALRFHAGDCVGVARLLPGLATVSFWFTDCKYE